MSHCIVVISNELSSILIPWSKYYLCLESYIGRWKVLTFDDNEEWNIYVIDVNFFIYVFR